MADNRIGDLTIFPVGGGVSGITCINVNGVPVLPDPVTGCITLATTNNILQLGSSANTVDITSTSPIIFPTDDGHLPCSSLAGRLAIKGLPGGNIFTSSLDCPGNTVFISLTGTIPVSGGGTGNNTYITNQIVIFNGTSFSSLPSCSAPGQVLVCEGSGIPSWVTITGSNGITVISTGGTITITSTGGSSGGASLFGTEIGGPACPSGGRIDFTGLGNIITSAAVGQCAGTTVFISLTGTIPVSGGGTGSSSFTTNQIVIFNGTSLGSIPPCSSPGQVLVCEGSGVPSWVSIVGVGVLVDSTGGTITLTANTSFITESGNVACAAGGAINLFGKGNIFTDATPGGCPASNTIFISLTGTIPVSGGGTGSSTFITNQIVIFNGTSLGSLPECSTPGQVLVCEGSGIPSWVTITGAGATSVVSNGSTITITSSGISTGGAAFFNVDSGVEAMATNGRIAIKGCTGGNIITRVNVTDDQTLFICLTGTIPVSGGGTGNGTFVTNQIVIFNGTQLSSLPPCTTPGQVLVCEGSGAPSWVTITGSNGVTVTSTGSTIIVNGGGGTGITWVDVTTVSQNMLSNHGYVIDNASTPVNLFLPTSATFGDIIRIAGGSLASPTTPWRVNVGSVGQTINMGTSTNLTTILATRQFDAMELLCISVGTTTNAVFTVLDMNGGPFEANA